jgi:hypothetical protein
MPTLSMGAGRSNTPGVAAGEAVGDGWGTAVAVGPQASMAAPPIRTRPIRSPATGNLVDGNLVDGNLVDGNLVDQRDGRIA